MNYVPGASEARSGALLLMGVGPVPPVVEAEAGSAAPPSVTFAVSGSTSGGGGALLLADLGIDFGGGKIACIFMLALSPK